MTLSTSFRAVLRSGACASAFCLSLSAVPALADEVAAAQPAAQSPQDAAPNDGEAPEIRTGVGGSEIVVSARRLRGQLDVETPPLLELNEGDITAEGVTSIQDLITQINNQTGSARGRGGGQPVVLINGIRVGSFREFSQYPPEALARVEVFPEEVAQRFGFSADQRVINLILKENFASREVELEFEGPSRGGYLVTEQELGYLQIKDGGRFNFNFEANDTSLLTESERDIIQTQGSESLVPGDPDQAEFRSLVNDSRSLQGSLSWAKAFIDSGTSVSANASYTRNDSLGLSGLNVVTLTDPDTGDSLLRTFGAETPLQRRSSTDTYAAAGSLNKPVNSMTFTSTLDVTRSETESEIDRRFDTTQLEADVAAGRLAYDGPLPGAVDAGFDVATRKTITAESQTTLRGPLAYLPAGELMATFDVGADWRNIQGDDTRSEFSSDLTRRRLSTGANLVVPITSRREGFADALGSFTLTLQAGLEDLSDFGLLGDYTVGLNWAPTDRLNFSGSYIYREVAPSLSELGDPQVVNFNVPVFDFTRGETVLATVTSGGNPDLLAETQRDWKFAVNWELPFIDNTRFNVEYIRNRSDNVTAGFPQITPGIEAAFPGRVTRAAPDNPGEIGRLIALDRRSVTFAETRSDRLQFQLSTRGSIGGGERGEGREEGGEGRGAPPAGGERPRGEGRFGGGAAPTPEQREQFMQFRAKVCAEDGLAFLTRLIERVDAGEDVSADLPGFDPERLKGMLARVRGEDGTISPEALGQFRERFCSMQGGPGGPGGQAGGEGAQQRGGGGGGMFGGGNPLSGRGMQGWRYFVSLTHTLQLQNEILIAPGLAPLDQLDGDATSAFGLPRNTARLEGGLFGNGTGFRLSGQYTGPTRIDGSGLPGSTDLFFGDLVTFDLRVFTNIGELTGKNEGFLKNLRVSLRADNIFDARRRVTDESGETPINYQPFLIDPTGRFIGIDIRKLF